MTNTFTPSAAAREASDYYNALPSGERQKLAPLLEHYRQMGLAEAVEAMRGAVQKTDARIRSIRTIA